MKVKPGANSIGHGSDSADNSSTPFPLYSGISVEDHREVKGSCVFYRGKYYIITKTRNARMISDGVYNMDCVLIEVEAESIKPNPVLDLLSK